jgi:hypothetical protein
MNLTPREKDKLLIAMAAIVARRRLERGVKVRFPWGSVFSLRCGSWPPRWTSRQEACFLFTPSCAIAVDVSSAFPSVPHVRACRKREDSEELFATASFSQSRSRRTAHFVRRLFSVEDTDSPRTFSVPRGAFTEPCRPLTLSWSPAGTPESVSVPPDPLAPRHAPFRDDDAKAFDLRVEGLGIALPVKAERPVVRERLPSCSRACKPKPASRLRETVKNRATAHRFAFCPPVPLVRKASSFCPASVPAIPHRPISRPSGVRDTRCVQPTSATRTTYCTRTSRIPSSLSRLAPGGHSAESQVSAQ